MAGSPDWADKIDEETFRRFRDGDQDALGAMLDVYSRPIIGFIRLITKSQEIAEEIAQEVFLTTYRHRERISDVASLRSWLFTLARREAIREMKRKAHQTEIGIDEAALEQLAGASAPTQGDAIAHDDLVRLLQGPLEKLRKQDRELIVLRYFCNLQIKEIAEVLEMPMGTVGVYLQRALERLRKQFRVMGIKPGDILR